MLPTMLFAGLLSAIASGSVSQTPARATPAIVRPQPKARNISGAAVTPATISFTATDPAGAPIVNGSASATVSWNTAGNSGTPTWTLQVSAPTTFTSCPTVPASAVIVTCASVTGGTAGACSSPTSLSPTPVQMAGGAEPGSGSNPYSVNLTFTLQDTWEYIASSSCSLSVTYTITAN